MALKDLPEWMQKTYWYFHGPVGHSQPRGANYMSPSGVFSFLIMEAVLFCVLMLGLYGVKKLITDAEVAKWVGYILILVIGGAMFLRLLAFAGVL